jgi:hypothetical protein
LRKILNQSLNNHHALDTAARPQLQKKHAHCKNCLWLTQTLKIDTLTEKRQRETPHKLGQSYCGRTANVVIKGGSETGGYCKHA